MSISASADPFATLGVPRDATEAEIRARYLELVKQFPPEREPLKFREIRKAFEAAQDPLLMARQLLEPPNGEPPRWADVIEVQKQSPPPLTPSFILSLGNRESGRRGEAVAPASGGNVGDSDKNENS